MPCGCKKGHGMTVRGGAFKRKRRRRGGGWISRLTRAATRGAVLNRFRGRVPGRGFVRAAGSKVGSGRARFLPGVSWHKGSGMGFSGAGMSWTGSGLRGKRMIYRQGSGRRMV